LEFPCAHGPIHTIISLLKELTGPCVTRKEIPIDWLHNNSFISFPFFGPRLSYAHHIVAAEGKVLAKKERKDKRIV
jgi:hypothetical protein